jgi:hypothetical protein
MLLFVPVTRAEAADLRAGRSAGVRPGHGATSALRVAHGLGAESDEDADLAALTYAGVAALVETAEPLRLVLALEVPRAGVIEGGVTGDGLARNRERALGRVMLREVRWGDVQALFLDDVGNASSVAEVRAQAAGRSLAAALDQESVRALAEDTDLLWYDPSELDHLPTPDPAPNRRTVGPDRAD